jgi:hypothetical protein
MVARERMLMLLLAWGSCRFFVSSEKNIQGWTKRKFSENRLGLLGLLKEKIYSRYREQAGSRVSN